jgi:hypothetical protein
MSLLAGSAYGASFALCDKLSGRKLAFDVLSTISRSLAGAPTMQRTHTISRAAVILAISSNGTSAGVKIDRVEADLL